MIKAENGHIQIKGNTPELLTDLAMIVMAMIVMAMKESGIDRDSIEHAVSLPYRNSEEVRKETEDLMKECTSLLRKIMEDIG